MSKDYYQILGVDRSASAEEIKRAYRKLAKQHHPDVNKGAKASEDRFKDISAAYDVLSDAKKRQQYDMLGNAFAGAGGGGGGPAGGGGFQWTSSGRPGENPFGGAAGMDNLGDLFSELFGMGGVRTGRGGAGQRRSSQPPPQRGGDIESHVEVEFLDALHGTTAQFELRRNGSRDRISVRIPPGVEEGQKLRIGGKGESGAMGGPAGDLYLTVHITSHPVFRRDGADVEADLPITIYEAILGGSVEVDTPQGKAKMKIPASTASGQKFRIKGKGAPVIGKSGTHGDFYAVIQIVPPKVISKEVKALAEKLAEETAENPRK